MGRRSREQPAALRATIDALLPRAARGGRAGRRDPAGAVHRPGHLRQRRRLRQLPDSRPTPAGWPRWPRRRSPPPTGPARPVRRAGRGPVPVRPDRGDRRDAGLGRRLRRPDAGHHQRRRSPRWPTGRARVRHPGRDRAGRAGHQDLHHPAGRAGRPGPRPGRRPRPRRAAPTCPTPSRPRCWPAAGPRADRDRAGHGAGRRGLRPRAGLLGRAGAGPQAQGGVLPARHGPVLRRPAARPDRRRGRRHPGHRAGRRVRPDPGRARSSWPAGSPGAARQRLRHRRRPRAGRGVPAALPGPACPSGSRRWA